MVITLHLEAKTAYMATIFKHAGAEVAVTGSNPLSTQDDVAAAPELHGEPERLAPDEEALAD